jgi:hypothetical protein
MQLTSAWQLIPEQSTAALIVHHREAKYYAVRGDAVEQGAGPASESTVATAARGKPRGGPGSATGAAA